MNKGMKGQNLFIVGGSPSTGSSLLRQLLNRHSNIYCAPETHLFAKKLAYDNWTKTKSKWFRKRPLGLLSSGLLPFVGMDISELNKGKIQFESLKTSNSFPEFATSLLKSQANEKLIIGEKTPVNCLMFQAFQNTFPKGKIIHCVRNPLDIIASLLNRGKSLMYACSIVLYYSNAGIELRENPNYYEIKYEDLVLHPEKTMRSLLKFLGEDFEVEQLKSDETASKGITKLPGWNYDETAQIGTKSIQRFDLLDSKVKSDVLSVLHHLKLKKSKLGFKQLFQDLGYDFPIEKAKYSKKLAQELRNEKWHYIKRLYFSLAFNYPVFLDHE